jgi:hypothetical protein
MCTIPMSLVVRYEGKYINAQNKAVIYNIWYLKNDEGIVNVNSYTYILTISVEDCMACNCFPGNAIS